MPITEECPKGHCTNPYGQTKSMLEEIMIDMHTADVKQSAQNPWIVVLLRYLELPVFLRVRLRVQGEY